MSIPSIRILVVHLEAMGAVLRSTSLLPAIKRKFPNSHVTWVTQAPADQLLRHNPFIDRVFTTSDADLLALGCLEFDVAFGIDKSLKAGGVLKRTTADILYGFRVDSRTGAIVPANDSATELWELGLSNEKKFFGNSKPETQLVTEALELGPFKRDEYVLHLSEVERSKAMRRRQRWGEGRLIVGFNTGCSPTMPDKKLSVDMHRLLIHKLQAESDVRVVLLGGPEDTIRNQRIGHGLEVIQSPTDRGLRDGLASVEACDIVVTGDSLGMHMAIALKEWVVAWFGPTCAHEIDLYDRGRRVVTRASCGPCWKRFCDRKTMCYDLVAPDEVIRGVMDGKAWVKQRRADDERLAYDAQA